MIFSIVVFNSRYSRQSWITSACLLKFTIFSSELTSYVKILSSRSIYMSSTIFRSKIFFSRPDVHSSERNKQLLQCVETILVNARIEYFSYMNIQSRLFLRSFSDRWLASTIDIAYWSRSNIINTKIDE